MNSERPPDGEPGRDAINCLTGRVVLLFRDTIPLDCAKKGVGKAEYSEILGISELQRTDRRSE